MEISRKGFLKLGTVFGAGFLLPAWAKEPVLKPEEESLPPSGEETFVHAVCGMCPSGCGIRVRKVGGRAVGVSGSLDHPINQGSLCPKGAAILQELHHPDRLRRPLMRSGTRGSGQWAEVSWGEAVRRIAERLRDAKLKGTPPFAAIAAPRRRDVHQELLEELAGSLGGGNLFYLNFPSGEPPYDAYRAMQGSSLVSWSLSGAKLLVSFGFDWLQSHPSHVEAQRLYGQLRRGAVGRRAHLVQVEPRFSVTAAKADSWLPIRPGTEGLLALGLARELIVHGNYDKAFVESARGFREFKDGVEPFTIDGVSQATGVPEREMRLLAVKLFSLRPAAAVTYRSSRFNQMAVHALNALLGGIGPGKAFSAAGGEADGRESAWDPDGAPPEVLLIDRVNPLFVSPARWKPVLERAPCVVTVSSHLSETAESSDVVLPCHSPLEQLHLSLHASMDGKTIVNAAPRAVEPLYDTKDPGEIFMMIRGAATGQEAAGNFGPYFMAQVRKRGAESLLQSNAEARWRELPGPASSGLVSRTPSGKFEFEPLTKAIPRTPLEIQPARDEDFPLALYVFTPLAFSCGEGAHLPYLQSVAGPQTHAMWETWAEIDPGTARRFGIDDREEVWIESRRGRIRARARIVPSAMPGVVSVPFGLGHTACGRWAKGVGANPVEILEESKERGGGALPGSTRVRIVRSPMGWTLERFLGG